jgi:chromosome segregation ATPase
MSVSSYRNKVSQINSQIADLMKKQVAERKKEVDLSSKINDLSKRAFSSKNLSTIQSYQRQIDSKSKELIRISTKVADFEKKLADKRKELSRNQDYLTKAVDSETKKRQSQELNFLKEKERINRSELGNIRNLNSEIQRQQNIFENYQVPESQLTDDDVDYSLKELTELHERINSVLEKLEKLGYGQEIIFDEIEQLKGKSKKISKKDLKMMLIGKIVSFGMGKIDTELAAQIFEEITNVDLTKLIE